MGKTPAFQFYIRDWLSDPELQSASSSSRGIWINALCFMWEARERGKLEGTIQTLSRLLNCTEGEFRQFLEESRVHNFDDLVTHSNGKVTLINRRMFREGRDKYYHRIRQDRYRQKKAQQSSDASRDAEVTPPSSSSSSSSTSNNKEKEKNKTSCPNFPEGSDEIRLSKWLFQCILERDPKARSPDFQKWARHVDLLIRVDGRSVGEIEAVIEWCQQDPFWQNNILSTEKLRKQFGQLKLKMNQGVPFQGLQQFLEEGENGGKRPAQICGPHGCPEGRFQGATDGEETRKRPG